MLASLEPVTKKDTGDCAVAALAMALGQPYRAVAEVVLSVSPRALKRGLYWTEIDRVAASFGAVFRKTASAEDVTGLLMVADSRKCEHALALFQGIVIDPESGLLWDFDTYVSQWKRYRILERVK